MRRWLSAQHCQLLFIVGEACFCLGNYDSTGPSVVHEKYVSRPSHPFVLKKQVMAEMGVGQVRICSQACSVCRRLWLEDAQKS